jgi:hypothetical protein
MGGSPFIPHTVSNLKQAALTHIKFFQIGGLCVGNTTTRNTFCKRAHPVLFSARVSENEALRGLLPTSPVLLVKRKTRLPAAGFPAAGFIVSAPDENADPITALCFTKIPIE